MISYVQKIYDENSKMVLRTEKARTNVNYNYPQRTALPKRHKWEETLPNRQDSVACLKDCRNPERIIPGYTVRNKGLPIAF